MKDLNYSQVVQFTEHNSEFNFRFNIFVSKNCLKYTFTFLYSKYINDNLSKFQDIDFPFGNI